MVGRVVELAPDGRVSDIHHGLLLAPARASPAQFLQLIPRIGGLGETAQADEVAVGAVGVPVRAGSDDDVRVSNDDLLRIDRATPAGDQLRAEIDAAGPFHQQAEVGPTKGTSADFRGLDAGRSIHEHIRFLFLDLGDAGADEVDLLQV